MPKLPALTGNEVIKVLEKVGFQVIRQKGSYVRMKHEDGGVVLRDAELTPEEFI
ncbi:MAG: type II toxin-antitoxin system HicA family toxin [Aphanothece sp. CMT-3BRIN-NPC111]|jgi:predicted RNA binding protein YcfA (HicA-like mRNA interferase family)|nr:type II toxin-antitoxin system HicA family toxin [Aphanothece sp. CMT-3BRIN-NPC111]